MSLKFFHSSAAWYASFEPVGTYKVAFTGQKQLSPQMGGVVFKEYNFFNQDLVRAWDAFTDTVGEKVYLKNTMINCKPVLKEDYQIEVAVHNPGQREELLSNGADILHFLSQSLRNSKIQLRTRISESNEKQLAYTTTEKYNLLLNINPAISKLKDEFDLRID